MTRNKLILRTFLALVVLFAFPAHARADWPAWLVETNCVPERDWFFLRNILVYNVGETRATESGRYVDLDATSRAWPSGKTFKKTCRLSKPVEIQLTVYRESIDDIPQDRRTAPPTTEGNLGKKTACVWNFNVNVTIHTGGKLIVDELPLFPRHSCRGSTADEDQERVDLIDLKLATPWVFVGTGGLSRDIRGYGENGRRMPVRTISRRIGDDFTPIADLDVW